MNLFGGAAKFVDFTNSKGEPFVANDLGTQFGTLDDNNHFIPHDKFTYNITVINGKAKDASGTIIDKAKTGTVVTIEPDIPTGKDFLNWSSSSRGVVITNTTFIMPENDVSITANLYDVAYDININMDMGGIQDGGIVIAKDASGNTITSATYGQIVTLSLDPDPNYEVDSCIVTTTNGTLVTVTNGTFIMPASNVNISATFRQIPLTLEAMVAGAVVTFTNKASGPVTYRVNNGAEQTIASKTTGNITLANIGDKVQFYGDNAAYATDTSNYSNIACNNNCYVYGNIMSLVKSEGFESQKTLTGEYAFCKLFTRNAHIKNKTGADLLLPATTLVNSCYCCMFLGCTNLTVPPELPATNLAPLCYYEMFEECSNLNSVTCLATDISAYLCTDFWLYRVAPNGTFTKANNMTGWTTGNAGIPEGWTVQNYVA